ncbi:OmpA family protein [Gaetbulibacter sp. M240]|uniref:OmpA family protein n=1 Tax=Gaetbulibacter sp. M240 TaxID=3126511 RepID=UPI00374F956C
MKCDSKTYLYVGFLIFLTSITFAQRKDKSIDAIDIYTRVVESGVEDENLIYRLANANYFNRDFVAAAKWYKRYFEMPLVQPSLLDNYRYGQVLKTQKKYKEADSLLLTYYNFKGVRYESISDANEGIIGIDNDGVFELQNVNYNTRLSEYPAFINENELYAVGYGLNSKKRVKKKDVTSDIYKLSTNGQFLPLSEYINSEYNEGPIAITNDGKTMYFTRNAYLKGRVERDSNDLVTINIYIAEFKNGKWKNIREFPFNSPEYSVGHPALSKDNKTLYYVSNIPGGKGGTDIYEVPILKNGLLGKPRNMIELNTVGNEMFPFIDPYNESLYFASDGSESFGGLDIFISKKSPDNTYKRSYNLGRQINSSYDDFSFMIGSDRTGYYASNKDSGVGSDDIYSFMVRRDFEVLPYINFKGIAREFDSNLPLARVKLALFDKNGNLIDSTFSGEDGYYEFPEINGNEVDYIRIEKDQFQYSEKNITNAMRKGKEPLVIRLVNLERNVPDEIGVTGKIIDKNARNTLANATVTALDIDGNILGTTKTKWYGFYTLKNVPSKNIAFLRIEKNSYQTEEVPVGLKDLDESGYLKIDLNMIKKNVPLELNNDIASILNPIHFDYAKSEIRPDAKVELDKVVEVLKKFPTLKIRIESYADSQGSYLTNIKLSHARAYATYNYIISQGISPRKLEYRGYGEFYLLNKCGNGVKCSDEEHRVNRRSSFRIIKI